ncbi:MAG TPA: hypothetical protein V6D14_11290 [Coleofasciculaceae cyanobacterium]|jgi:hypothetical protein
MKSRLVEEGTVFSIMVSAIGVGLAVGLPLGYALRYFDGAPFGLNLGSLQQNQPQAIVDQKG